MGFCDRCNSKGFTLAEALIALALLGLIAAFAIPKVLESQRDEKFKAIGRETAHQITAAYELLAAEGITASTYATKLLPYMQYVAYDTTTVLDNNFTENTVQCSAVEPCILLSNGARLFFWAAHSTFGGTATTNAMVIGLDPDGKVTDGTTNGPGKTLSFVLYYDGHIRTIATMDAGTASAGGAIPNNPTLDPPWFSWN